MFFSSQISCPRIFVRCRRKKKLENDALLFFICTRSSVIYPAVSRLLTLHFTVDFKTKKNAKLMSRMNQSLTINVPVIPYRLNVIFVCDEKVNQQANIFIECLFIDFTPLMEKDCKIYLQFHCTNSVCLSMVYCSVCIRQQLLLIFSRTNYIFRSVRLRIVFSVVNFIITLDNILNRNKIRRRRRKKREKNLKNE